MAVMIPDYTTEFTTKGERRFYEFLAAFAKPDDRFTSWYLPDLEGREPDFILYSDGIGLIVFEIKDWAIEQIEEADQHTFVLKAGGKRKRLKSPLHQAREYLNSLMDRIKSDGRLVSQEMKYRGNSKIPLHCGVVFPNINKQAYCRKRLDRVIDANRVFFRDDLHLGSDICSDGSGKCFQNKLAEMFPPKFQFQITRAEYSWLKQLLFPIIRVQHTQRDSCVYVDPSQRVHVLDDRQEAVARRLTPEVNLVRGPSGSGKTLVLVHRAAFLKAYRPETGILFLCFNIALVNYIKRLFSEKGVGLRPEGVQVFHFYEYCSKVLGEEIQFEKEGAEYYQLVVEETLSKLKAGPVKYDAVIVDEGQEFSAAMLGVVSQLLDPARPCLTLALDEGQGACGGDLLENLNAIFHDSGVTRKKHENGIFKVIPGKVRIDDLQVLYRNTVEIRNLASRYTGRGPGSASSCEVSGPRPELLAAAGIEEVAAFVSDTVRRLVDLRDYPLSEIAVLYARRRSRDSGTLIPELVMERLESRGIVSNWVAEDYRSKRTYDITTDRVSILNIHSSMGLDWACVFLLGLDELEADGLSGQRIKKLVYTGITRARHRLFIPYCLKSALIENLIACLT